LYSQLPQGKQELCHKGNFITLLDAYDKKDIYQLKSSDFTPVSYYLDLDKEDKIFNSHYFLNGENTTGYWLIKPAAFSMSKGFELVPNITAFKDKYQIY